MITQTELETFRDELITARAKGLKRCSFQSPVTRQEIEMNSDREMAAALADVERRLRDITGAAPRIVNLQGSKGYRP